MNIRKLKHIHFTGIKGVGMASLALCAKDLGIKVSGSDIAEVFVTDDTLAKRNISWKIGFSEKNLVPQPDLLITTGAHGGLKNPEVLAAKKKGIPVMTLAQALAEMAGDKKIVAVCGVGGKTTISSMIAVLLDVAVKHPSFAIGVADIFPLATPGRYDHRGKHFICEADEYAISPGVNNKPRFSLISPKILIVTNIEHDHPDIYPTFKDTKRTFRQYLAKVPADGLLLACIDNSHVASMVQKLKVPIQSYGFNPQADWQIKNVSFRKAKTYFSLTAKNGEKISLCLKVPGRFNIQNATAAFLVGRFLGIKEPLLKKGLLKYKGCRRRFEKIGERKGILVFDDYAHHPQELKAILKAAREWFPQKRIMAVFQPHTYSRTRSLLAQFAKAFAQADTVAFMDIYASAREAKDKTISSRLLAERTKKFKKNVFYSAGHEQTLNWLKDYLKPGDVVLTLGAGDIFHLHKDLLKRLNE